MTDWGLSDEGLRVPRTDDWLEIIRDDFAANPAIGVEIDWSRQTVLGPLTLSVARGMNRCSEMLIALNDSRRFNNMSGTLLDDAAQLSLTEREDGVHSTVELTLTSTATSTSDVFVEEGSLVEGGGSDGRARWETLEAVTIPSGGGTVDVVAQSVEEGAIIGPAGELDRILSPTEGWASVTNAAAATLGKSEEQDPSLRRRIPEAPYRAGRGGAKQVRERLRALSYITSADVLENDTSASATVEGIVLPQHSIAPIIYPATLTDAQLEEMAQVIFDAKGGGCRSFGTEEATVFLGEIPFTIGWSYATAVAVTCSITVEMNTGFEFSSVEDPIAVIAEQYYSERLPGDDLVQLELEQRITQQFNSGTSPAIRGIDVLFDATDDDYDIAAAEIATLSGSVAVTEL